MARTSLLLTGLVSVVAAASQLHLLYLFGGLRPNILCLQLSFSAVRYWDVLSAWGADGLQVYREHFAADMLHLCIYALFGHVVATRGGLFAEREARASGRLARLLPLAALFDLVENLLQLHLLAGPFGAPSVAIPVSAACSSVKWGLAVVFAGWTGQRVMARCLVGGRSLD